MVIFQVKVVNYHLVDFSFQIFDICRLTKIDILDLPFLPILIKKIWNQALKENS